MDIDKIWHLTLFPISVEKIQVPLKSNKNNGFFTWRRFHIYDNISLNSFLIISNKSCRKNLNTHFTFSNFFLFRKSCRLWDNVEKYGGVWEAAENMVPTRGMLNKATRKQAQARARAPTSTHSHIRQHSCTPMPSFARARAHTHTQIRNTYCFSTATVVSWTRLNVTLHAHCLSCFHVTHEQISHARIWRRRRRQHHHHHHHHHHNQAVQSSEGMSVSESSSFPLNTSATSRQTWIAQWFKHIM